MRAVAGFAVLALACAAPAQKSPASDLLRSAHNLAAGGPGPVTSADSRPCVFCHIPHNAYTDTAYLWNQQVSTAGYAPYQSPTFNAAPGIPSTGSSHLCLSCHDGTVAAGQTVASGTIALSGGMPAGSVTGVNFGIHHPVGIRPVDDGALYPGLTQTPAISADPAVQLSGGVISCTTCHEAHKQDRDAVRGTFLVRSNQGGAICLACHDANRPAPNPLSGWIGAAHQMATQARVEFYGTVAADACLACHRPHNAAGSAPLLRAVEQNTCSVCHAGTGTTPPLLSVMSVFTRVYAHPVDLTGLHSAAENAYPLNASRHAECPDCHNSHAALTPGVSLPPALPNAQAGATGVDGLSGYTAVRPASNQFEVCFKCHAYSAGKPQASIGYSRYGRMPRRVTHATSSDPCNKLLESNSSISRHNVTNPRQRTAAQVPSLRTNLLQINGTPGRSLATGYIYCEDCHNNDQARNSGGAQASGVHGSQWPHILERRYATEAPPAAPGGNTTGVAYQAGPTGTYAICYKCHDVDNNVVRNRSFTRHGQHVTDVRGACSTCHDSHGINGGNSLNNYALVNFDTAIVGPSSTGQLRFERTGTFAGRCYLRCHGENHNPYTYP